MQRRQVDAHVQRLEVRWSARPPRWMVVDVETGEMMFVGGLRVEAVGWARRMLRQRGGEIVLVHGGHQQPWKVIRVPPSESLDSPGQHPAETGASANQLDRARGRPRETCGPAVQRVRAADPD